MWSSKQNKRRAPDPFEQEIFDSFAASEHEVTSAAENPFLARRVRVAISQEERQHAASLVNWSLGLQVAMRAVPGFAVIAIAMACVFWYSAGTTPKPVSIYDRPLPGDERVVASSDFPLISNDDMLSIVLGWRPADARGEQ